MFTTYPTSIYAKMAAASQAPRFPTDLSVLEAKAKEQLPSPNYWYAAGGCGLGTTMINNREAFDKFRIVPRGLRNVNTEPDLTKKIFGQKVAAPIVMAPVGAQKVYHPDGDLAVSKVFAEHSLPYCISSYASTGLKDAAAANGDGNRWFQLYMPADDAITKSLLTSAKEQGYTVLVLTIDTWSMAWRPHDLETGFLPFLNGVGTSVFDEDPHCQKTLGFNASSPEATMDQKAKSAMYMLQQTGISPTWEKLAMLREIWGERPIVVKGVQSVEDAIMVADAGMDGIVVSNHGGRQVDGAIGSLQALPRIVDAVGHRISVGFDSGIRCGADIFKAVALGADYVMVGRPIIWGLALGGREGVSHVLDCLMADFRLHVALSGCKSLAEVTREMLADKDGVPLVSTGSK